MIEDTIYAIASPPGSAERGLIRLSGPAALAAASSVLPAVLEHRRSVVESSVSVLGFDVPCAVLVMPGPHSYTGEHVLELQGHGGPVVLQMLLDTVLARGARLARPGEFSERAFLNDKLDLAQAEAVADLINSSSRAAARGAMRALSGAFSSPD